MYSPIERTRSSSARWILMDRAGYWRICTLSRPFAFYVLTYGTRYKIKDYPSESHNQIILHVSLNPQPSFPSFIMAASRWNRWALRRWRRPRKLCQIVSMVIVFLHSVSRFCLVLRKRPTSHHQSSFHLFQHWKWSIITTLTRSSWYGNLSPSLPASMAH